MDEFAKRFMKEKYKSNVIKLQNPISDKVEKFPNPIGRSGIEITSYEFNEDYLDELTGSEKHDIYDKMKRGESQLAMVLNAIKGMLKKAVYEWDKPDFFEGELPDEHYRLCQKNFFENEDKPFHEILGEAFSAIEHGFSLFEEVNRIVMDDKEVGTYISVDLKYRAQKTIEEWHIDPVTSKLLQVRQVTIDDNNIDVLIDGQRLRVVTIDKEGDNYEGISKIRSCYGPWKRKNVYLKLIAIGTEKFAIPTTQGKMPRDAEEDERQAFKTMLSSFANNETKYIAYVDGWEVTVTPNNFDASKILPVVNFEDVSMVKAFVANFLELGMSGAGGSFALSTDLSDFFLNSIEHIADLVCKMISSAAKRLILLNFGPQDAYPVLKFSGVSDKAGSELATVMQTLVNARILTPDDDLEDHTRKRYGLPTRMETEETRPEPEEPDEIEEETEEIEEPEGTENSRKKRSITLSKSEKDFRNARKKAKTLTLASKRESVKSLISKSRESVYSVMTDGLSEIGSQYVKDLMKEYRNLSASQKQKAVNNVDFKNKAKYQKTIKESLSDIAGQAAETAFREAPKRKSRNAKKTRFTDFDVRAKLLTETQLADLYKTLSFGFISSVKSTDSESQIEFDLNENLEKYVASNTVLTAAANAASETVNTARFNYFFEPEVLDTIESFTFSNDSPESDICRDLVGTTVRADDPTLDRYAPPLHHNCDSYLVSNLKDAKGNPKISPTGLKPSDPALEKDITL